MSKLKFVPDEFLESIELNRFSRFLKDDGFYADFLNNTGRFGIVKNEKIDPTFSNFRIVEGTASGTIKILNGFAYNNSRDRIYFKETDNIEVPISGEKQFLKISYTSSPIEIGTVSISTSGYLTGTGTEFTKILRGQPNFPSLIQFVDSELNLLNYEVLRVIDDTNAQLQGIFSAESGLEYKVIGTFTPGIYPTIDSQFIFQYDYCTLTLVPKSSIPSVQYYPTLATDTEFIIGVVSNTAGDVTINDSRYDFIYRTQAQTILEEIPETQNSGYRIVKQNPLIAVTSIKKLEVKGLNFYQISLDWKFKMATKAIDRNNRIINVTVGNGGKYNSILDFTNGDFDGWRIYYKHNGEYSIVLSSTLISTTHIELVLDYIPQAIGSDNFDTELNDFAEYICPNAEALEISIEIPFSATAELPLKVEKKLFMITSVNPQILVCDNELYGASFIILPASYQYKNHLKQTNY